MSLGLSDLGHQATGAETLGKVRGPWKICRAELLSVLRLFLHTGKEEAEVREELSLSMAAGAPGESQREPSCFGHPTQGGADCSSQRKTSPFFHCRFLLPNPGLRQHPHVLLRLWFATAVANPGAQEVTLFLVLSRAPVTLSDG